MIKLIVQIITFWSLFVGINELLALIGKVGINYGDSTLNLDALQNIARTPTLVRSDRFYYLVIFAIALLIYLASIPLPEFCGKHRLLTSIMSITVFILFSMTSDWKKTQDAGSPFLITDRLAKPSALFKNDFIQTGAILMLSATVTDLIANAAFPRSLY
jgi:hypothetical protein